VGRGGNYAGDSRDMASWYWSLWRGFNHSLTLGFALTATVVLTFWIIFRLTERRSPAPQTPAYDGRGETVPWSWLVGGWMAAATVAVLGMWRSATTLPESVSVDLETALQLGAAVVMLLVASLLVIVAKVYRPDADDRPKRLLQAAWILSAVFVLVAAWQFL